MRIVIHYDGDHPKVRHVSFNPRNNVFFADPNLISVVQRPIMHCVIVAFKVAISATFGEDVQFPVGRLVDLAESLK
jgi:hypothetical protein